MLTATSSHPSRNFSEYGVMSVHPMPCPPDFASGRVYHIDPSEPTLPKPGTLPAMDPITPAFALFSPTPTQKKKTPPAAADIAFFSTRRLGLVSLVSLRSSFTPSPSVFKTPPPLFWWENDDDDDDDDDDAVPMVTKSCRRPRPPRREEESGRGGARHFDHNPSWFFERAVVVVVVVIVVVVLFGTHNTVEEFCEDIFFISLHHTMRVL